MKTKAYRKTDGLEVDCYAAILKNDVKRRFNLSHVTKVSAQTFARGCKNVFSWEKRYIDFLILLTENILH